MATFDNRSSGSDAANNSTYTFSAVAIGTAAADRYVIVGFYTRAFDTTETDITSVTIGGVSAAEAAFITNLEIFGGSTQVWDCSTVYIANVPTGTTADVVVTYNNTQLRCGYVIGTSNGINPTPTDTLTDAPDGTGGVTAGGTIDVASSGIIFAISGTADSSSTATWTGATEINDSDVESSSFSGAYLDSASPETGRTLTCGWASPTLNTTFAAASFAPSAVVSVPFLPLLGVGA